MYEPICLYTRYYNGKCLHHIFDIWEYITEQSCSSTADQNSDFTMTYCSMFTYIWSEQFHEI